MKPFKGLFPLAIWLMRFAVVFFALTRYWDTFVHFNFQSVLFYVSTIYIIFSAFFFIGGFLSNNNITVISSLILIFVTGYHAFLNLKSGIDHNFAVFVVLGSVLVYFLSVGNKR